jgi:hypothetical protein
VDSPVYKAEQLNVAMLVDVLRKFGRAIEGQVQSLSLFAVYNFFFQ